MLQHPISRLLQLFFLLFCLDILYASDILLGVAPKDLSFYSANSFKCFDGSKIIPRAQVNDDYCDCKDGSDEPGTSACDLGQFWCVNKGHVGRFITSSWVGDGICDCCDGLDESMTLDNKCQNTCSELAKEATKGLREELAQCIEGITKRKEAIEKLKVEVASKRAELEKIEEELIIFNEKVTRLEEAKNKVNQEYEGIKGRLEEKRKREEEEKNSSEEEEAPIEDEYIDFKEDENDPHIESQPTEEKTQPGEEQVPTEPETQQKEQTDQGNKDEAPVPAPTPEPKPNIEDHPDLQPIKQDKSTMTRKIFKYLTSPMQVIYDLIGLLFPPLTGPNLSHELQTNRIINEKEQVEKEYNEAKSKKDEIGKRKEDIEKFLALDFGPDGAFFEIYDKDIEYKTKNGEYTYVLQPFVDVEQRGSSSSTLGNWDKWSDNYTFMHYTNGKRCWGGPDRSCKVEIICGKDNEILDVQEPNKCEYTMQLKTPAACTEAKVNEIHQEIDNLLNHP